MTDSEELKGLIKQVTDVNSLINYCKDYVKESCRKLDVNEFNALLTIVNAQMKVLKPESVKSKTLMAWIEDLKMDLIFYSNMPNLSEYEKELARDNRKFLERIEKDLYNVLFKFVSI
jgi:hypothetical protein